MKKAADRVTVCAKGRRMTKLSIRRMWTMYAGIMFADTISSSKGGRLFGRAIAHGAFYAGARSTLKVLAYMLERGEMEKRHRTIAQQGRQIKVIQGCATEAAALNSGDDGPRLRADRREIARAVRFMLQSAPP